MKGVGTLPKFVMLFLLIAALSGCYTRPDWTFHKPESDVRHAHIGISAPSVARAAFVNYHFVGTEWNNAYWEVSPFWDNEFFLLSSYYYHRYYGLWANPYGLIGDSPFWGWLWNSWFNPVWADVESRPVIHWTPGPAPYHRQEPSASRGARIRKSSRSLVHTAGVEIRPEVEWHAISLPKKEALPERRSFSTLRIREKPLLVPVEREVPVVRAPVLVPRSPMLERRTPSIFEQVRYLSEDDAISRGASTSELRRSGFTTGVRYRATSSTSRPSPAARVRKNTKK